MDTKTIITFIVGGVAGYFVSQMMQPKAAAYPNYGLPGQGGTPGMPGYRPPMSSGSPSAGDLVGSLIDNFMQSNSPTPQYQQNSPQNPYGFMR